MKADTLRRYQESVNDLAEQLAAAKADSAALRSKMRRIASYLEAASGCLDAGLDDAAMTQIEYAKEEADRG